MKASPTATLLIAPLLFLLPACTLHEEEHAEHEHQKIVATSPMVKEVVIDQQYVCQIHSRRHIDLCVLEGGYLEEITVREGQAVKKGEVLFRVNPTLYRAKLRTEQAEVQLAQQELNNNMRLLNDQIITNNATKLFQAKLAKAQAKADLAQAELDFATVRAPFDGIIDRLMKQQGSLVKEGEMLTTLSDNGVMWVYFNVPEARYLEYKALQGPGSNPQQLELVDSTIELVLAGDRKFGQSAGNVVTLEGQFNNETGNIPFRADFPNPDALLRHNQTGNVIVHRHMKDAVVIPQRATFEILDKRYVFVIDEKKVVRQREIAVAYELEDVFVVGKGLSAADKFVLEGVRQVHDGEEVEAEFRKPSEALANQKNHAE